MEKQTFANLQDRCFKLVKTELRQHYNGELLDLLVYISLQHKILCVTDLRIETYKGIIGYYNWLTSKNIELKSFIQDALHDLREATKYRREDDGYCPRTSQYVEFYTEE